MRADAREGVMKSLTIGWGKQGQTLLPQTIKRGGKKRQWEENKGKRATDGARKELDQKFLIGIEGSGGWQKGTGREGGN